MDNYAEQFEIEKFHLNSIKLYIKEQLEKESKVRVNKRNDLITARKDMYDNTIHSSNDFDKLSDAVQYLSSLEVQTNDYRSIDARINKYEKMLNTPYFARIDFTEEGCDLESIYIGLGNLADNKTHQVYICDWRAPISSIFYRYGLGKASYKAPYGMISGDIQLKRQFDIKNGELKHFLDSSLTIMDDILKLALSQNSSPKMKNIVETIQREQDIIIRDIENDVLIVQGVAGSGKTSIALHRVAFLLYHGLNTNLKINNIVLIAPNTLFEKYIDNVLPELGEKNIKTLTQEDIFNDVFENSLKINNRNSLIEKIVNIPDLEKKTLIKSSMNFKLSKDFILILERFLDYYTHRMIEFSDVYYNSDCIVNRHLLKDELIKYNNNMPLEKSLATIEARITSKIHELRKMRLVKLEKFVSNYPEHSFEIKSYARLLSLKESSVLKKEIYKFTRIDALQMYKKLIRNKYLFYKLSYGINLPENIETILSFTNNNLENSFLEYEDGMALLYLKLKMSGCSLYKDVKQVVVDEAQDYYPLQYEILKRAFKDAKYTIMGDINQSIEKEANLSIYDDIKAVLNKKRCSTVFMKKSFRCSYEISRFSSYFIDETIDIESVDRHEDKPKVHSAIDHAQLEASIIDEIIECRKAGYESIAIICKSMSDSENLYNKIGIKAGAILINSNSYEISAGVSILPIYMAKGLEFDAVILYQTNDDNYNNIYDKKLLYIGCTRALHKLSMFYIGEISRLIPSK